MGWCSGTDVFDSVVGILLDRDADAAESIEKLVRVLWSMDWDCEMDSRYWEHPLVQQVFRELKPQWFEDSDA